MKSDLGGIINAILVVRQHLQEINNKNEALKELHIEGGT